MLEIRHPPDNVLDDGIQRLGHEQHARAAVGQHIGILIRRQQRVERHRHDAGADRAEKDGRKVDRVEHDHRHALFAADAEPAQHVGDAAALLLQIAIAEFGDGIGEGELARAALVDIAIEQPGHRIVRTGRAAHDASPQVLRIIIHRKTPASLAVNPHRHYVSEIRSPPHAKPNEGNDRGQRPRNRLSRAARPACAHHAGATRHVAQGARESFGDFRALYRAARKRQGQCLDRAAAARVERDGRASGRSHSRNRAGTRLGRDPRPLAQGNAGPGRAGQGRALRRRPLGAAADLVRRHRPDRPARRRQIHARQDAGEEDRLEVRRAQQGDRGAERIVRRRDHRALRPGRLSPHGAGGAAHNCWRARN